MNQISRSGHELGGGVPLPASSHITFLYDGFTTSFNTPEGKHRHPTLFQSVELIPCASAARCAGAETRMKRHSRGARGDTPVRYPLDPSANGFRRLIANLM